MGNIYVAKESNMNYEEQKNIGLYEIFITFSLLTYGLALLCLSKKLESEIQ